MGRSTYEANRHIAIGPLLLLICCLLSCASPAPAPSEGPLRLAEVWQLTRGEGETVAVLDTGIIASLARRCDCVAGVYDAAAAAATVDDRNGHGSGLVAALVGDRELGLPGIAPRTRVLVVRVTDPDGHASSRALADGVDWAVRSGATVINISLATQTPDPAVEAAVRRALARHITVVAAAGNGGDPVAYFPASVEGVLAAVAVADDGRLTARSNDPGGGLRVPAAGVPNVNLTDDGRLAPAGEGETSQAAILVSGLVALGRAAYRRCHRAFDPAGFAAAYAAAQEAPPHIVAPIRLMPTC